MGVNSIRTYKLSAIVPRILNKKKAFIELFFCKKKKNLLVGASGMLWTGQWMSEGVRDVCMSHQSD